MFHFIQIKSKIKRKPGHEYLLTDSGAKNLMEETNENKERIHIMR